MALFSQKRMFIPAFFSRLAFLDGAYVLYFLHYTHESRLRFPLFEIFSSILVHCFRGGY